MTELRERPNYIDLAKAFGMFCVVLGHFIYYFHIDFVPNSEMTKVSHFVTLFHMPFFFIVSGIVSSFKVDCKTSFVIRQVRTLLLPYFAWGGLLGGSYVVIEFINNHNPLIFLKFFIALISGSDFPGCALGWAGQLWFVYALFFIKILLGIGLTLKSKFLKRLLFGVFLCIGGGMLFCAINPLPFRIDCIFVGFLFVAIGFWLKNFFLSLCQNKQRAFIALLVSICILILFEMFYVDNSFRQGFSINSNYFGKYPPLFILSGMVGSVMLLSISKLIFVKHGSLIVMSNGLICYLALHRVMFDVLHRLYSVESIYGMVATSVFVFVLLYPITIFVNKYFPFLLGFRK